MFFLFLLKFFRDFRLLPMLFRRIFLVPVEQYGGHFNVVLSPMLFSEMTLIPSNSPENTSVLSTWRENNFLSGICFIGQFCSGVSNLQRPKITLKNDNVLRS